MAGVTIENVRKAYGTQEVLKDFSLDIADGEFVVLVGPSGCGKSTMLKIIAGLEAASAGRVLIGGRDVTDLAPGDRDIAMVFQNYALYPHLTVRGNMGFGLRMRGTDRAEIARRVDAAARMLGVEHLLDRRLRALSGGQRQRVALGRAMVREPQAFLMDEPLSNLDASLRAHTRAEISALHRRLGVTTIYVTHDQVEAMTMADRIVVMRDGAIQQIADPDTMFRRPANLFVAGFIGAPAMNFLRAAVLADGDSVRVELFGQGFPLPGLRERAGQDVILGLRPDLATGGGDGLRVTVAPQLVESLGSEKYIHVDLPPQHRVAGLRIGGVDEARRGETLILRLINPPAIAVGRPLDIGFDVGAVLVFAPDTQALLGQLREFA